MSRTDASGQPFFFGPGIWLTAALAAMLFFGCRRDEGAVLLAPPYADDKIGDVSAVWSDTGEERAFAEGRRLDGPEVRFRYRVDVRNRLEEKVFLRLEEFNLIAADGVAIAKDPARVECALNAGRTTGVLSGEIWVPKRRVQEVRSFRIGHLSVPLGDRARAAYREWLLKGRPGATTEVDAEIGRYAAVPACMAR